LTALRYNHTFYLMTAKATVLYRNPEVIFAAADRGETVTICRNRAEYTLIRKRSGKKLYGAARGSILKDTGKPRVKWKAMG
jgi:hypothetical protein